MNQQQFTVQNSIQYLQEYQQKINYSSIKLTDEHNNRYQYPVLTLQCNHFRQAINLETILESINKKGYYTCICNADFKVQHPNQLQKDIRWNACEEINEIFDYGLVIHNQIFLQFQRAKKYNDAIKVSALEHIKKFMESQNSIDIYQIFQSISNSYSSQKEIIFKTICLLDFVQLSFPVRFKQCQHPECYDLASLLIYQQENCFNQSQIHQLKQFKCKQRHCQVKVDISTQDKIFENIYMDIKLLQLIKKGLPSNYKYRYNLITKQIQQDIYKQDNVMVDPQIYQNYQLLQNLQCSPSTKDYQNYQKQVTLFASTILQTIPNPLIVQNLKLHKYKKYQVLIINQNIEQPARCINCPISYVMDLKTILSNFQSQKILFKNNVQPIKCPLCKKEYEYIVTIPNVVYFDQNLFDAFEQGLLQQAGKIIYYNGKKLMIEEFQAKQKLELEDFKQNLQEKFQHLRYTFNQLYCCSDSKTPINFPLILKNCPEQRIVEFDSFYNCIEQLQQQDYEQKCLKFCPCQYCSNNPFSFKEFAQNVYFHEAFHQALIVFNQQKQNKNLNQFTYDFNLNVIIQEQSNQMIQKSIPINQSLFRQGFVNLLDDEEYQKHFQKRMVDQKYYFEIVKNQLSTPFGTLINTQNGYFGDARQELKTLNQKAKTNQDANNWGFEITKIETQFKPGQITIIKGQASSELK